MIKKIISIFCVLLLFVLIGCNNSINNEEGEIKGSISVSRQHITFEKLLMDATDAIKGKCVNIVDKGKDREYEFQILERYAGEEVLTNIFVYEEGSDDLNNAIYEIGKKYYLILNRYINVLYEHDRYTVSANLFVPADDIEQSTMYGDLLQKNSDLPKNFDELQFKNYVIEQLNNRNPEKISLYGGQKYTIATDMQTVIREAEGVFQVEIMQNSYPDISEIHDIYQCKVTEVFKGNIDVDAVIEIFFAKNTVQPQQQYIVAVNAGSIEGMFHFSSQNSLFDITQYDAIIECINE